MGPANHLLYCPLSSPLLTLGLQVLGLVGFMGFQGLGLRVLGGPRGLSE